MRYERGDVADISKSIHTMINDDADVTCMPLVGDELWLVTGCTFSFEQLSSTLATVVSEGDDFCGGERLEDGGGRGDAGAGVVGDGSGSVNSEDGVVGVEEDSEVSCSARENRTMGRLSRGVEHGISHRVKRRHGQGPRFYTNMYYANYYKTPATPPATPPDPLSNAAIPFQWSATRSLLDKKTYAHAPSATASSLGYYPGSAPTPGCTWMCLCPVPGTSSVSACSQSRTHLEERLRLPQILFRGQKVERILDEEHTQPTDFQFAYF